MRLILIMLLLGVPYSYAFGLGVSPGSLSIEKEGLVRIYNPTGSELELQLSHHRLDYTLQESGKWIIALLKPKQGDYEDTLVIQASSGAIAEAIEVPVHVHSPRANPLIGSMIVLFFIGLGLLVQRKVNWPRGFRINR